MSLIRAKAIQMGYDATATNNFLIYQPLTPDGTFRIAVGNQGATTDIMTVTNAGSVTFAGATNFATLNFGSGTQTAPSLAPVGNTNTGVYFPATNTVSITTNGTERLRVDNTGIGVGMTAAEKLSVNGNIGLYGGSKIYDGAANNSAGVTFSSSTVRIDGYNGITFNSSATTVGSQTERMRIASSGNVGIGNISPTEKLVIDSGANGTPAYLGFRSDGASAGERLRIGYSYTDALPTNQFAQIDADSGGNLRIASRANAASTLQFYTSAASSLVERMRINSTGYVGIGNTGPMTGLDVRGTSATAASTIQIVGTATSTLLLGQNADGGVIRGQGGNNALTFWTGGSADMAASGSGTERMRIDSTGNAFMYGQGAASKGTLTLQSTDSFLRLKTTGGTTDKQQWDLRAISATGSEAFEIRTINDANTVFSTKLWIANSGNIGIANTSPSYTLHVQGNAGITGGRTYIGQSTTDFMQIGKDAGGNAFVDAYKSGAPFGVYTVAAASSDGSSTRKLLVDSEGRVTAALQPSFLASNFGTGGNNITGGAVYFTFPGDTVWHNTANCYSTSTYTFTAPIAGRYYFHGHVLFDANCLGNSGELWLSVNNDATRIFLDRMTYVSGWASGKSTMGGSCVISLSVGDIVKLKGFIASGSQNVTITQSNTWSSTCSSFGGYLLG